MADVDDERLEYLRGYLRLARGGFANNCIWQSELLELVEEVIRYRAKPLHCPGCDGDHA